MAAESIQITGLIIACPFCGTANMFAGPPVIFSRHCCNPECRLYVCESEWKKAFLDQITTAAQCTLVDDGGSQTQLGGTL